MIRVGRGFVVLALALVIGSSAWGADNEMCLRCLRGSGQGVAGVGSGCVAGCDSLNFCEPSFGQPSLQFSQGIYEGNGTTLNVTTVGFLPEVVLLHKIDCVTSWPGWFRIEAHDGEGAGGSNDWSCPVDNIGTSSTACFAGAITGFLSNGFSVGSGASVNTSGQNYAYVAFAGASVHTGGYTGNSSDPQNIAISTGEDGCDEAPKFAAVWSGTGTANDGLCYRGQSFPAAGQGANCVDWGGDGGYQNGISSLLSTRSGGSINGFQVNGSKNISAEQFWWFAVDDREPNAVEGFYVGTEADTSTTPQVVPLPWSDPQFVSIHTGDPFAGECGEFTIASLTDCDTQGSGCTGDVGRCAPRWVRDSFVEGAIQHLTTDPDFEVNNKGTGVGHWPACNGAGDTYVYWALRQPLEATLTPTPTETPTATPTDTPA